MKKLIYVDESNFEPTMVEIEDELYDIAEEISNKFGDEYSLMVCTDKKSLMFGINKAKDRFDREIGKHLYRVTIEKIE